MNEKYSTSRYDLDNVSAGSNVIFADSLVMSEGPQQYLISRGVSPYRSYIGTEPSRAVGDIHGVEDVSGLRLKLLGRQNPLEAPVSVRVRGTLFPSGLLASGWWEKNREVNEKNLKWSDELQEWLFAGFDLWGPSWDFCWNLDDSSGVVGEHYAFVPAQKNRWTTYFPLAMMAMGQHQRGKHGTQRIRISATILRPKRHPRARRIHPGYHPALRQFEPHRDRRHRLRTAGVGASQRQT